MSVSSFDSNMNNRTSAVSLEETCQYLSDSCSLHLLLLASGDFCCLMITFANSLNPIQDRPNVGPDLD